MFWLSKIIHLVGRLRRRWVILLAVLGPGIITMVADNDAGGISTYTQTGARTGFNMLWAFIILVPMAYYVQEMTVRLGAVTKRGHAEAIFDGFGKAWGWFSLFDLCLINWLTLVTEYIGMTQAMSIFNIPEWVTFLGVTALLLGIVISGKYWTFEKITLVFCIFNLVYIPAAIWAMQTGNVNEGWSAVGKGFYKPEFQFGGSFTPLALITLIMANIGTTITPWQIFFQQSAVVDKGMDIKDAQYGKINTFVGSLMTCGVAAFIIVAAAGVFYYNPHNPERPGHRKSGKWGRAPKRPTASPARPNFPGRLGPRQPTSLEPSPQCQQLAGHQVGRPSRPGHARRHAGRVALGAVGSAAVRHRPVRRRVAGGPLHLPGHELGHRRGVRLGPQPQPVRPRGALVLRPVRLHAPVRPAWCPWSPASKCRMPSRFSCR